MYVPLAETTTKLDSTNHQKIMSNNNNRSAFLTNEIVQEFGIYQTPTPTQIPYNNTIIRVVTPYTPTLTPSNRPPLVRQLTFDGLPEPLNQDPIEEEDPDTIVWTPEEPPRNAQIPHPPPLTRSTNIIDHPQRRINLATPINLNQTTFQYM